MKPYLDYLAKEMAIMGVLSVFSVATLAAVLFKVLGAEKPEGELAQLPEFGRWLIVPASVFMLLAALYFYRQRSLLALHYGDIAYSAGRVPGKSTKRRIMRAMRVAHAWSTWIFYRWAFCFLSLGLLGYILAFVRGELAHQWGAVVGGSLLWWLGPYATTAVVATIVMLRVAYILENDDSSEPFYGRRWWGLGERPSSPTSESEPEPSLMPVQQDSD